MAPGGTQKSESVVVKLAGKQESSSALLQSEPRASYNFWSYRLIFKSVKTWDGSSINAENWYFVRLHIIQYFSV